MRYSQSEKDNRRQQEDRRNKPTSFFSKYALFGRRRYNRRVIDRNDNYYVDRYGKKSLAAFISIFILCVIDARITLLIIKSGGREINPFMNFVLSMGSTYFLLSKYIITAVCLLVLIVHKNFYIFNGKLNVKTLVVGILVLYFLLVIYEINLVYKI